ncbi:MAG: long-chain fatty acid--CoA ligase [Phycisphaerales bacterium]|nr:long-chain fatty acid--CoA ligase [Phycisphaerales bacterium]
MAVHLPPRPLPARPGTGYTLAPAMSLRLLEQLDRHATDRPDDVAIGHAAAGTSSRNTVTWTELRDVARRLSGELTARVPPGGVLLLCSPNRAEFTAAFLGGLRAGLRVFPVSPTLAAAELRAAADQSAAAAIIGTPAAVVAVRDLVPTAADVDAVFRPTGTFPPAGGLPAASAAPRSPESAALLLHSSGTTGVPKVVVRTGRSLDAVAAATAEAVGFGPGDRVLACVPLCHSYGIEHGLLAPLWAGSTVRLCQGFDVPTVLAELDVGATIFPGVPFAYEAVAARAGGRATPGQGAGDGATAGRRFPALRRAYSAGGPLPDAVVVACRVNLGLTVTQLYGATEIGSVTYADPDLFGFDPASVGRGMRGVDVRILPPDAAGVGSPLPAGEVGQVAVRADSMLTGYLDGSPAPLLGGYFLTGDLGRLEPAGNLTVTGRLKLLIEVGGLKVNPLEVEAALAEHPAVAACLVVPLPVSPTVTRLKAIVVARRPGGAGEAVAGAVETAFADGEALRRFLRERLAPYKVPRLVEFRADLPRSAAGKVLRQQVEP